MLKGHPNNFLTCSEFCCKYIFLPSASKTPTGDVEFKKVARLIINSQDVKEIALILLFYMECSMETVNSKNLIPK